MPENEKAKCATQGTIWGKNHRGKDRKIKLVI